MRNQSLALALFAALIFMASPAEAKRHNIKQPMAEPCFLFCEAFAPKPSAPSGDWRSNSKRHGGAAAAIGLGRRPGAWCGWFMQKDTGITSRSTGRNLNMAREWRHVGSDAGGPGVGVIVVWARGRGGHVGRIVGRDGKGQWVVRSGNDGGAVRERPRSVAGAIAFRRV